MLIIKHGSKLEKFINILVDLTEKILGWEKKVENGGFTIRNWTLGPPRCGSS